MKKFWGAFAPYAFATLCLIASLVLALSKFRGAPTVVAEVIAGAILVTSYVTTFLGVRAISDNMWVRMAIAILAPAIIGLSQS